MKKLLIIILLLLCLAGGFCFGAGYGEMRVEPQVVYSHTHTREYLPPVVREVEVPVYIEKMVYEVVEKLVYIEKPVYQSLVIKDTQYQVALEPFGSVPELMQWLREYEEPPLPPSADCDDFAMAMFFAALADGKLMDTEIIEDINHLCLKTFIKNSIYFIDIERTVFRENAGKYWVVD